MTDDKNVTEYSVYCSILLATYRLVNALFFVESIVHNRQIFFTVKLISCIIVRNYGREESYVRNNKNVVRILTYFSQFTINMIVPIGICSFIGYLIDEKFGTNWCFVVLFFVGAAAGARNIYILAKKTYEDNGDDKK